MPDSSLPRGHATYINKLNKIKVLDLIRKRRAISRAEIAKVTGLSAPTVTRVVDSLINEEKLVVEGEIGDSTGGRRPILVEFNGEGKFLVGIDLGTTYIRAVLANLNAEFLSEIQVPTEVESGFDGVMNKVGDLVNELINRRASDKERIAGIGMAVAGLINKKKNIVEFSPDFGWHNADINKTLGGHFDLPLIFDNVTRVMALGELWYGIGKKYSDFICVNIGYGIGSGIIVNGRALLGSTGMAGEFGHLTLNKDSEIRCQCGNRGCLEALASGRGIALAAQRALESGRDSSLRETCGGEISAITTEMVAKAAQDGDAIAGEVFKEACQYIGIGIAGLINLFNPQAVVIGGGVAQAGDVFFDTVKQTVEDRVMNRHVQSVEILPVTYGNNATLKGAVSLILHEVLTLNHGRI
jgi:glucokinase-like ROK family protein